MHVYDLSQTDFHLNQTAESTRCMTPPFRPNAILPQCPTTNVHFPSSPQSSSAYRISPDAAGVSGAPPYAAGVGAP